MFSKLLKNNKKSIQKDWCGWSCLVEGKPAMNMVDCNAFSEAGKTMQSLVVLIVFDLGRSRNGFPTAEVFIDIYAIEEKIEKAIDEDSRYAGRVTTDGLEYYLVYTKNPPKIIRKLEKIEKEYNYKIELSLREDKEWKIYFDMLYPSPKEKQKFHNTTLIRKIIQVGSNPEKEHLIDHAIFFNSEKDRDQYLKELKKRKFPMEKYEFFDDRKNEKPFTLQISIRSVLKIDLVNNSTNIFVDLADKYNALYDGWGTEIVK